jgi:hypothetical protein
MWHNGDWDWMQKSSRPRIGRAARRRSCHIGIQGLQDFGTGSAAAEAWRTCPGSPVSGPSRSSGGLGVAGREETSCLLAVSETGSLYFPIHARAKGVWIN